MKDSVCRTCKHFAPDWGECRRRSPALVSVTLDSLQGPVSKWPETSADKWCGEYEPTSEPKASESDGVEIFNRLHGTLCLYVETHGWDSTLIPNVILWALRAVATEMAKATQ